MTRDKAQDSSRPSDAAESSIVITLDDSCVEGPECLEEVLAACTAHGFKLSKQLANIGILCGTIRLDRIDSLRAIPHIRSVDLDEQRSAI